MSEVTRSPHPAGQGGMGGASKRGGSPSSHNDGSTDSYLVAEVRKNTRESVRVSLTRFRGHDLVDLRVWADNGGDPKPTKAGITLRPDRLHDIIAGLSAAQDEARRRGWLP